MRLPLVIVLALALLALGFLELRGRPPAPPPPPPVVDVRELAGPRRPSEHEAIPVPVATIPLEAPTRARRSPVEASFERRATTATLVRAVDAASGQPHPGSIVDVFARFQDPAEEPVSFETTMGADGTCAIELPEGASLVHLSLRSPELGVELASWSGAPAAGIEVAIPPEVFVNGALLCPSSMGLGGYERLEVRIQAPIGRSPAARYCGRGEVIRDASFRVPVRLAPGETELEVRVVETGRSMPLASLRAPVGLWTEPPGPTVRADIADFELQVEDVSGPLEGADVALQVELGPDARGVARAPFELVASADGSGRVAFLVPCGDGRLTISHPGRRAIVERILLPCAPLQRSMRRLHPSETFAVRGLDERGEPVAGATVSVESVESGARARAVVQATTDPEGRAVLPLAVEGAARIHGYHPDHGLVGPIPLDLVRDALVVFRFEEALSVALDPRIPSDALAGACGRLDWCAVDLERSRSFAGRWTKPPYVIGELPRGDYVVFALFQGSRLHAYERLVPGDARVQVLPLAFRAGLELRGRVLTSDPGAIEALLDLPDLPDEIEARFCATRLLPDGSFALFAGSSRAARAAFRLGERTLWSATVDPAQDLRVVLHAW